MANTATATETTKKATATAPAKGAGATRNTKAATKATTKDKPTATVPKVKTTTKDKPTATVPKAKNTKIEDKKALAIMAQREALAKEAKRKDGDIRDGLATVEYGFQVVAFGLHWFKETEAYRELGAKSFPDFAKTAYGIEKRTAYNFCSIVERFGARDKDGNLTGKIRPAVATYSSSQLLVLLDVDDAEIEANYSPDMSVRAMKDKVKESKTSKGGADKGDTGSSDAGETGSGDSETKGVVDTTIKEVQEQALITFDNMEEYDKYLNFETPDLIAVALKNGKKIKVIAY